MSVPEEIKKKIRSVLISNPKGVETFRFLGDFRNLLGEKLYYKKYGFSSLGDFLRAIPDVVRVEYDNKTKTHKLYGVTDSSLYLPSALKKGTRRPQASSNPCRGRVTPTGVSKDMEKSDQYREWEEQMKPNLAGQYALCFPKQPEYTRESVVADFSQIGEIAEISFTQRYIFVRFNTKMEALNAMEIFHDEYDIIIPIEKKNPKHVLKQKDAYSNLRQLQRRNPDQTAGVLDVPDDLVPIYVGGLPVGVTPGEVLSCLQDVHIYASRHLDKDNKRFMFLEVRKGDADAVITSLHHKRIRDKQIVCQLGHNFHTQSKPSAGNIALQEKLYAGQPRALTDLGYEDSSSSTDSLQGESSNECTEYETGQKLEASGGHEAKVFDTPMDGVISSIDIEGMPDLEPIDMSDYSPPPIEPRLNIRQQTAAKKTRNGNVRLKQNGCPNMYERTEEMECQTPSEHHLTDYTDEMSSLESSVSQRWSSMKSLSSQESDARRVVYHSESLTEGEIHENWNNPDSPKWVRVSNFEYGTTWQDLYNIFEGFGVLRVNMLNNVPPKRSVAVVRVKNLECACALLDLHMAELGGRMLLVTWNTPSARAEIEYGPRENLTCKVNVDKEEDMPVRQVFRSSDPLTIRKNVSLLEDSDEESVEDLVPSKTCEEKSTVQDTADMMLLKLVKRANSACCLGCRPWCPADLDSCVVEMVLTYVISNSYIWAQIKSKSTESELQWLVNTCYELADGSVLQPYDPGSPSCAAQYDGAWYRGWVQSIHKGKASVFFLDYGNIEQVEVTSLRGLPRKYWRYRPQAWPVSVISSIFEDLHSMETQKVVGRVLNYDQEDGIVHMRITGFPGIGAGGDAGPRRF